MYKDFKQYVILENKYRLYVKDCKSWLDARETYVSTQQLICWTRERLCTGVLNS